MKTLRFHFLPIILAAFFLNGCASVAPGSDPVVVNAERTVTVAADSFDTFLKSEYETRDALKAASPAAYREVHGFAEYLRASVDDRGPRAKQWLKSARVLTAAYKTNRTPANKANLQTILNTITAAMAEAQKYLLKTQAAR